MPPPSTIPAVLLREPFTREEAISAGLSGRVLEGRRFVRLHPRVWWIAGGELTPRLQVVAARKAMPELARLSHVSRLHELGLPDGRVRPVHFTVQGELHIAMSDVRLHRTVAMPPCDDVGVTPAAAFIMMASSATTLELVVAGDWLLSSGHASAEEIVALAMAQDWRPGSAEARALAHVLDPFSASPAESRTRAAMLFSGLPVPSSNADLVAPSGEIVARGDLVLEPWRTVVEYEGRQHVLDLRQFNRDIARYADLRAFGWDYVQVTAEMAAQPRALVMHIHQRLVRRGYAGPPPSFGRAWQSLTGLPDVRVLHRLAGAIATTNRPRVVAVAPGRGAVVADAPGQRILGA